MYEKVAASDPNIFDRFWSRATVPIKRKASPEYLRLWALAAVQGSRQAFEDEVFDQRDKKRRIADGFESQESHAADVGEWSQESLAAIATSLWLDCENEAAVAAKMMGFEP